jgi:hypothetical protein
MSTLLLVHPPVQTLPAVAIVDMAAHTACNAPNKFVIFSVLRQLCHHFRASHNNHACIMHLVGCFHLPFTRDTKKHCNALP